MAILTEHQRHDRVVTPGGPEPQALDADRRRRSSRWLVLGLFVLGSIVAGLIGTPFTDQDWYQQLERPPYAPPGSVFGPVWSVLYLLIGVAAFLVWRHVDSPARTRALQLWLAQLVLNALWTPLYFGARWIDVALVEVVVLWVAVAATVVAFLRVDRVGGLLLVPYAAWTTYAVALTAGIAVLN